VSDGAVLPGGGAPQRHPRDRACQLPHPPKPNLGGVRQPLALPQRRALEPSGYRLRGIEGRLGGGSRRAGSSWASGDSYGTVHGSCSSVNPNGSGQKHRSWNSPLTRHEVVRCGVSVDTRTLAEYRYRAVLELVGGSPGGGGCGPGTGRRGSRWTSGGGGSSRIACRAGGPVSGPRAS
jgi:hypothetical protein